MGTVVTVLWTCPRCGRQFKRKDQVHSCSLVTEKSHFERKNGEMNLYLHLKKAVKKQVGTFKTEALKCCIHFVTTFTFAAVKILKGRIRVDFTLHKKMKSKRVVGATQMSARRWLYAVDVYKDDEIESELLAWIKKASEIN